jgi:hypothetical protein
VALLPRVGRSPVRPAPENVAGLEYYPRAERNRYRVVLMPEPVSCDEFQSRARCGRALPRHARTLHTNREPSDSQDRPEAGWEGPS